MSDNDLRELLDYLESQERRYTVRWKEMREEIGAHDDSTIGCELNRCRFERWRKAVEVVLFRDGND